MSTRFTEAYTLREAPPVRYCSILGRRGNIAVPCGQVLIGGTCPIHGPVGASLDHTPSRGRSV